MAASPATGTTRFLNKREAMLGAAARLFNERGVKGTTLADIAAAVGLVTNSVTYYYRKKETLATACFLRSIDAFNRLAAAAAQQPGAAERLHAFFGGHAQLLAAIERGEHPPLVTFGDIRALPSPQQEEVFSAYNDMFRRVRDLLKDAQTMARLSRDDFNARGHIVLSNVHWVRVWIQRHEVDQYGRVAQRVADFMLHGLRGPAAELTAGAAAWTAPDLQNAWVLDAAVNGAADGENTQGEAFLRAATVLVNEQGYRGASVDKISARLNVTKGSFYHHNHNKHDLIAECFERSFTVLRRALVLAADSRGSGWERICAAAHALVRYQLGEQGPLLRFSATSALPDQAQRERVGSTMHRLTERLGGLVVDGMADRSIRPLDAAIAAQLIMTSINAAAELRRWLPGASADNVADLYVRPLLDGVLSPPAAQKANRGPT
jgi:AcrR family transcriptional regulator